jgi:VanZ family protein
MKRFSRAGLVVALGVLATVLLVPNTTLAWIRSESPWLSNEINQIEMIWPSADTVHILAFATLGVVARLALPNVRAGWIILGALLFSMITELLQFFVPGRTPLILDVRDNMLGLLLGLGCASFILWMCSRFKSRRGKQAV